MKYLFVLFFLSIFYFNKSSALDYPNDLIHYQLYIDEVFDDYSQVDCDLDIFIKCEMNSTKKGGDCDPLAIISNSNNTCQVVTLEDITHYSKPDYYTCKCMQKLISCYNVAHCQEEIPVWLKDRCKFAHCTHNQCNSATSIIPSILIVTILVIGVTVFL